MNFSLTGITRNQNSLLFIPWLFELITEHSYEKMLSFLISLICNIKTLRFSRISLHFNMSTELETTLIKNLKQDGVTVANMSYDHHALHGLLLKLSIVKTKQRPKMFQPFYNIRRAKNEKWCSMFYNRQRYNRKICKFNEFYVIILLPQSKYKF